NENNGGTKESADQFLAIIEESGFSPLKDDALLFFVESSHIDKALKFAQLSSFLTGVSQTPIKEKLLWEQAKLAEQVTGDNCESAEDCFFDGSNASASDIYELLILQYPQGFYAPYARERLTDITNQNS
ncbi:MAG TPA: hypothetical protein DEG32_10940, partial [Balneolaceae bacterium]|nr:hypothetical protein [Balneolaceae bacterium]